MARKKHGKAAAVSHQAITGVVLEPNDTAPVFYVNYMEIGNTANDFTIFGARLPAKLPAAKLQQAKELGTVVIEPDVLLVFPTLLVPGLIRALTIQKETYEKLIGSPIIEPGVVK